MSVLFAFLLLLSLVAFCVGLIKPSLFVKLHITSRKAAVLFFGTLIVLFFILTGVTAPTTTVKSTSLLTSMVTSGPTKSKIPTVTSKPVKSTTVNVVIKPTRISKQPTVSVTGFGAVILDWNAYHNMDTHFAANSSYNPSSDLGNGTRSNDVYYGVLWSNGGNSDSRIIGYNMRFPKNQNQSMSQLILMREFPTDTIILWQKNNTTEPTNMCYQMEIQSKTLASILSTPKIGDTDGEAIVEFFTEPTPDSRYSSYYDPQNVNSALLQLGSYQTASDAPEC